MGSVYYIFVCEIGFGDTKIELQSQPNFTRIDDFTSYSVICNILPFFLNCYRLIILCHLIFVEVVIAKQRGSHGCSLPPFVLEY